MSLITVDNFNKLKRIFSWYASLWLA